MTQLNDQLYGRAVSGVQGVLISAHVVRELRVDGKWGKYTANAYASAPASVRWDAEKVADAIAGVKIVDLASYRYAQRVNGVKMSTVVGSSDIRGLIQSLCQQLGVPFDTAYRIAWLESKLNPNAKSPTGAIGVFQLTTIARNDVAQKMGYTVTDPYDPTQNITCGLKYIQLVSRYMSVPMNDAIHIYMGFNIGPTGARAVLAGNPNAAASVIKQQAYGPPAVYAANLSRAVNSVLV